MAGIKRDSADKWFSDCIRHAAGYQCEHCHKGFGGLVQGLEIAKHYRQEFRRMVLENSTDLVSYN